MPEKKTVILHEDGETYPCPSADLHDDEKRPRVFVCTLANSLDTVAGDEGKYSKPGITFAEDGIYDIVVDVPELTYEIVSKALKELSNLTGIEYILAKEEGPHSPAMKSSSGKGC